MIKLGLVSLVAIAGCGGGQRPQPSAPPAQFCAAILAGDLGHAGASAHGALLAAGADRAEDATAPLVAWLTAQPCVAAATADTVVVAIEPGIREIAIALRPDAEGVARLCTADLTLAVGAWVGIHPANWNSENPDPRQGAGGRAQPPRHLHCTATASAPAP